MRVMHPLVLCLIVACIGGCAFLPRDAGFSDVESLVAERVGEPLHWAGVSLEEEAIRLRVEALLGEPLSAAGAVRLALLNNPSLQAGLEEMGIARADLVRAGLLRNPVFGATLRFPEGGGGTNLELSLVQEFLNVVQLPMRRRVAVKSFEQVKLRTVDTALTLVADTQDAFYEAQASLWVTEIRSLIVDVSEAMADVAERLHHAGNITDLDLAKEKTRYQQVRLKHMQAQAHQALAQEQLAVLLGLAESSSMRIPPRLPELPPTAISESGLEDRALAQRLDLAAVRMEREILLESLGGARFAALQPDFGLGVEAERETDGSWLAGPKIRMNLPVFDGGGTAVDAKEGRLREALRRERAMEVQIRSEVRQAWVRLQHGRQEVDHYQQVLVPLHARIMEESQLQYNAMQLGVFQLLNAKREQLEVGALHVDARKNYWLARNRLARVVGGLLPEPEPLPVDDELEDLFGANPAPPVNTGFLSDSLERFRQ